MHSCNSLFNYLFKAVERADTCTTVDCLSSLPFACMVIVRLVDSKDREMDITMMTTVLSSFMYNMSSSFKNLKTVTGNKNVNGTV